MRESARALRLGQRTSLLTSDRGSNNIPKPFLKWAGGKRQILPVLNANFPHRFGSYFEPFLGGGAVLLSTMWNDRAERYWASDTNHDLITTYVVIRDRVEELISALEEHAKEYESDRSSYYYKVRSEEPGDPVSRSARMIFLNRTCFNGLYRVNGKGKFNVPMGRYANPAIVNAPNLRAVSRIMRARDVTVRCGDFSAVLDEAREGDFVYMDPPYEPVSRTAQFTSYTKVNFTRDDLKRLARLCQDLHAAGCSVLCSNSNTAQVRELFDDDWTIMEIAANRTINSNRKRRAGHTELLIRNF